MHWIFHTLRKQYSIKNEVFGGTHRVEKKRDTQKSKWRKKLRKELSEINKLGEVQD